ncbi:MAG: endolytic transglycosylase MltG [Pseudomonadota bacterium]
MTDIPLRRLPAVFLVLLCVGLAPAIWAWVSLDRPLHLEQPMIYDLARGGTIDSVAVDLSAAGVLPVPSILFRLYARLTSQRGHLQAGEYELTAGMDTPALLDLLRSGRVLVREITFVEGWTFADWRRHLADHEKIVQTLAGDTDEALMAKMGFPGDFPEGRFFPDTYHYVSNETDLSILRRAHERMRLTLAREWEQANPPGVLTSPYEALILASIVEKETGFEPDREIIAGVFVNRLLKNMRLQSDPTVIYGITDFNGDLTRRDLVASTPYNTYTVAGLPPTPICNPGLASIRATLNPAPVPYYYFVARGDGSSQFSVTLQEHNRAVAIYQKGGRQDP